MQRSPLKILILLPHYLPGFKAGGPTRSIANLVTHLGDELDFRIVTRDRDLADRRPYPGIVRNSWQTVGKARVAYLAPGIPSLHWLVGEVRRLTPSVLYLNSFFDWQFAAVPLLLERGGVLPNVPTIVAPRGQFDAGALRLRRWKKLPYLAWFRALGLQSPLVWHGTSEAERQNIERLFGSGARSVVVPNICDARGPLNEPRTPKRPGELRLVFLSRISRKKNLARAIELLPPIPGRGTLDVWGPIEDATYWRACRKRIADLPANVSVTYRGVVHPDRVTATLAQYDALLLPTEGENFGHVIAEAFAAGCPVVVSDRTPWRGLAERGVGWDLPLEAGDAFKRTLSTLTAMDERAHRSLRTRVAAFGQTLADAAPIVDRYRAMFHAVAHQIDLDLPDPLRNAA